MGLGLVHLLGALGIATPCQCGGASTADASPGIPALPISLVARQEACHDELSALGLGLDLAATSVRAGPTPLLGVVGRCRHMEATGYEALHDGGGGPSVDVPWQDRRQPAHTTLQALNSTK